MSYKFVQNSKCEYFPCHSISKNVMPDIEDFNCLFCFCPLFSLGSSCGGNFQILSSGIKDCSFCSIPHQKNKYDYIIGKLMTT
jgi:Zn-finger protein